VGSAIPFLMLAYAISLSIVSNSFLTQVEVIYSMIIGYVLLKERITKQQSFLAILSFFGVALVLTNGVLRTINLGDAFFLLAPLFFQLSNVVAKAS
jgi:drug/metabolite transporter (DMT)-like permease